GLICKGHRLLWRGLRCATTRRSSSAKTRTVGPPSKTNRARRKRSSATEDSRMIVLQIAPRRVTTLLVQVPSFNSRSFIGLQQGLTNQAEPRQVSDVNRESGTEAANTMFGTKTAPVTSKWAELHKLEGGTAYAIVYASRST